MKPKRFKTGPTRSSPYLAYIRGLGCLVDRCPRLNIQAAHTGGHGLGQKAPDTHAVPLCPYHHRYLHELGPRQFEERYNLNLREAIARLNAKPRITVESGTYIATIEGQEYVVGPVAMGMEKALRIVQKLWWEDRKDIAS